MSTNIAEITAAGFSPTRECDVAVIGSGAAGLSAALAASANGASVVILEKSTLLGGTTALSGGGTWIPCHHHMSEIGASNSPEEALRYIRAVSPKGLPAAAEETRNVLRETESCIANAFGADGASRMSPFAPQTLRCAAIAERSATFEL